jgi:Cd2+/Zn2+-exporting ATPase
MVDVPLDRQIAGPAVPSDDTPRHDHDEETIFDRYGLIGSAILTGVALTLGWLLGRFDLISGNVQLGFYIVAYLAGGTFATKEALVALWNRSVEIDLLMVTAAIGAATVGHWAEGALLLFLFSLGTALEHFALGRTTRAVRALMELSPEEALAVRDGQEVRLHIRELRLGDEIIVKPGERIPADGVVLSGESGVDQAAITGESIPVVKTPGEQVFAGTLNGQGALRVTVNRLAHESTLAKIIAIVQDAQADKSRTQRFTDRFEGTYAIGVIAGSALFLLALLGFGESFSDAFYRAMILLVVASPCALVISTPASTLSALANAARNGILVKGSAHLENIGAAKVVAFDKTGTLTMGKPRLTDILPAPGVSADELLTLAASAERASEHPLAEAIVNAAVSRTLPLSESENLQAITGQGIRADVDGQTVLIGNAALFEAHDAEVGQNPRANAEQLHDLGRTTMYVGVLGRDGAVQMLGVLGVADTVRPVAREVVQRLKELGIEHTVMLTGDNRLAASAIARQTGIDEVEAELLPEDKLTTIERLKERYGNVVMVGDGVNDAPALARATAGVAMGAAGSDVALETADVVLMADDLTKLPYAIQLSRKARRIIVQNLTFALSIIVVMIAGTIAGLTTLPLGVIAHEGGTIIVVANGLRLLGGIKQAGNPIPQPALEPAVAD